MSDSGLGRGNASTLFLILHSIIFDTGGQHTFGGHADLQKNESFFPSSFLNTLS